MSKTSIQKRGSGGFGATRLLIFALFTSTALYNLQNLDKLASEYKAPLASLNKQVRSFYAQHIAGRVPKSVNAVAEKLFESSTKSVVMFSTFALAVSAALAVAGLPVFYIFLLLPIQLRFQVSKGHEMLMRLLVVSQSDSVATIEKSIGVKEVQDNVLFVGLYGLVLVLLVAGVDAYFGTGKQVVIVKKNQN